MCKQILLCAFVCVGVHIHAQSFPSMKGYWYCKSTNELFVISTDPDQTVKGRGVLYSNGNGRFTTMQIMTQTPQERGGETLYMMRVYDPAKPKKVFELFSVQDDGRIVLESTITGARNQVQRFYQLKDLNE